MHTRNRRILIYSFLLLFMMACRTSACGIESGITARNNSQGLNKLSCTRFFQVKESLPIKGHNCIITCPSGEVAFDFYGGTSAINDMMYSEIQAQYCPGGAPVQQSSSEPQPTEPPTEEPTEEPAPTEPPTDPAPLNPYLTGKFTHCDNAQGYVNFTIADDAPPYNYNTFKFTFNGQRVECASSASNPKILWCPYPPAPNGPPATIQVFIGDEMVNNFEFPGGAICDSAPQPDNPDLDPTEEPSNPAAPTEDPGGSG